MKKLLLILIFGLCFHLTYSQVFEVDTLHFSGSINNRINLVILGDGYQSNELSKFIIDANYFIDSFFDERPFSEYKNYFNVFAIKVPSNESGASHPRTGPDNHDLYNLHPLLVVDNYFGSTFDYNDIHRLLFPVNAAAITNVLASNFPSYDQVIVLVNSTYYGGSGGEFAILSTHEWSAELALHELGHSFSDLADEYYAGDDWAKERFNMTQIKDPTTVKWKKWMNFDRIGIYQHCCGGNSSNWYRPHEFCKMRILNNPYCSVCIEGIIEEIHSLTSPIDSFFPSNEENFDLSEPTNFSLILNKPNPNTLKIEWYLNDSIINDDDDTVLIAPNNLIAGVNHLQAVVEDKTTLLRIDNHEAIHIHSVIWKIDSTTLSIVDVSEEHFKFELFPNPTKNILNIKLEHSIGEKITIQIFSIYGQELISKTQIQTSESIQLNLNSLTSGVYIIKIELSNGHIISRKIMKD